MLKYFVYSLKWVEGECSKLYRWRVPGNLYQNYMYIYKFIKKRGQFYCLWGLLLLPVWVNNSNECSYSLCFAKRKKIYTKRSIKLA